uniref:Uncharacterized protein n=1 Tax=Plectus sambesii TaxID=2011161 RepID=A0A914VZC4_9BILA
MGLAAVNLTATRTDGRPLSAPTRAIDGLPSLARPRCSTDRCDVFATTDRPLAPLTAVVDRRLGVKKAQKPPSPSPSIGNRWPGPMNAGPVAT